MEPKYPFFKSQIMEVLAMIMAVSMIVPFSSFCIKLAFEVWHTNPVNSDKCNK